MKSLTCIALIVLVLTCSVNATSVTPEVIQQLKSSGEFQQFVVENKNARDRGIWEANPNPYSFGLTTNVDTLYCLILLVDFDDMTHEMGFNASPADFDSLLFSTDVFEPGSMTDYYFETSYGQALLIGQVTPWFRMPQLYSYYVDGQRGFGTYPQNAQRLTEDAVLAADSLIDFAPYDNNGDLMVDGLFVVHAGPGYEDTGNLNFIHSHAWVTSYDVWLDDSVYVRRYSMEPEETGNNQLVHIGVFCHEFGHVLGLPDLYDYDYDSNGTGMWSIMSGGSWGGGGTRPVHFDAWCKIQLGWVAPTVISTNLTQEQIDAVEYNPDIYLIYSRGIFSNQYFLVENRRQQLFDASLPGEGLLIYHIDDSVPNNNNQDHYLVAVEQADGLFDLENNRGSDAGDPWPGTSNNRTFDDYSVPNAWLYFQIPSEVAVSNISDSDSVMYANLFLLYDQPLYNLLEVTFTDNGNNNGFPEAGETCNLIFSAQNIRADADNLFITVSCLDSLIQFLDPNSSFGSIPHDTIFNNLSDPITFYVTENYPDGYIDFLFTFSSNNGQIRQEITQQVLIGVPEVFLIDDDGGDDIESFYTSALDSLNLFYNVWDISTQGSPANVINTYDFVLWFTGDIRTEPVHPEHVTCLIQYLGVNNGHLLLTSQDFVQNLSERSSPEDTILLHDYLKVDYEQLEQNHSLFGVTGSYFNNMQFFTIGGSGAQNQISQDALTVLPGGIPSVIYGPGSVAASGVLDNYSVLTCGFGIEGINGDVPGYNTQADFIQAARQFLLSQTDIETPAENLPELFTLSQNYPNPFNASTTISFTLSEPQFVMLTVYDLLGSKIQMLLSEQRQAGIHSIIFDASDLSSGVYFYRLQAGDYFESEKMILLK